MNDLYLVDDSKIWDPRRWKTALFERLLLTSWITYLLILLSLTYWTWYFKFCFPLVPKIVHHPGLMALWDENQTDVHSLNKWILFLNVISPNKPFQNVDAWMNLPSDLVISSAACYYLYVSALYSSSYMYIMLCASS